MGDGRCSSGLRYRPSLLWPPCLSRPPRVSSSPSVPVAHLRPNPTVLGSVLRLVLSAGELGGQALALRRRRCALDVVVAGCPEVEVFVVRVGRAREGRARRGGLLGRRVRHACSAMISACRVAWETVSEESSTVASSVGPLGGGVDCAAARRVAGRVVDGAVAARRRRRRAWVAPRTGRAAPVRVRRHVRRRRTARHSPSGAAAAPAAPTGPPRHAARRPRRLGRCASSAVAPDGSVDDALPAGARWSGARWPPAWKPGRGNRAVQPRRGRTGAARDRDHASSAPPR